MCYTLPVLMRRFLTALLVTVSSVAGMVPTAFARTPNDTFYSQQWYLKQINAEQAWDTTTGSPVVVVAVIDTAMDIDHEDLRDNIWTNAAEIFGNGIDDDNNGYIDDVHGWNFERSGWDVRPNSVGASRHGLVHATLVASLIAARGDNGIGMAGVAWNVRIMPLVALDAQGSGSSETVARAIRYAVQNGATIINVSLEGYEDDMGIEEALIDARSRGVLTVAAAGNAEEEVGIDVDAVRVYPVCLSLDAKFGVVGVGSTDRGDEKAPFANTGSCIQVSAPGDDIFGARPTATSGTALTSGYEGGWSGTSLAAPLVTGAAALIKSLRPDWGWAEIRDRIMMSSDPIDHLQDVAFRGKIGRGRLNLAAAVAGLTPVIAPVPVAAAVVPTVSEAASSSLRALTTKTLKGVRTRTLKVDAGFIVAEMNGGRAWGIGETGTVTPFAPYGKSYRAGLEFVAVPGGAAFAPRGGGGHLVVFNTAGQRLVSAFPFGKTARGRWSVKVQGVTLMMSGPKGSLSHDLTTLGPDGWN